MLIEVAFYESCAILLKAKSIDFRPLKQCYLESKAWRLVRKSCDVSAMNCVSMRYRSAPYFAYLRR